MDATSPPHYRRFSRPSQELEPGTILPPYTRRRNTLAQPITTRREPTEHLYQLFDSRNQPWVTLKVYSSAKSSKSLPTFFEKENINGSLSVHVEKSDSIHAISATITGRVITGANSEDSYSFLNVVVPIWSKSTDLPRLPSRSEGTVGSRLTGHCVWPLSIALPRVITGPNGEVDSQAFRLPETFLERHTRASVQYDLTIKISRGKLRADNRIQTAFGYVPSTRPEPPSYLRQLAYQQNLSIPSPEVDPEGWKTSAPIRSRGMLFKSQQTEVECTLSLAKPLSYTRGSFLPCSLTLECQDPHALHLLAAPSSVVVHLRRKIRFFNKLSSNRTDVSWTEAFENVGTAVWWPSSQRQSDSTTRHLEGEFRLAKDLRPSCNVGHFSVSYAVVLCPFDVGGFSPADSRPLLAEPVEITTMHAKGPRAQGYSPPAYDNVPRNDNDFYATMRGHNMLI